MKLAILPIFLALMALACQQPPASRLDAGAAPTASEVSPSEAEVAVSKPYSQFVDVRTPEEYSSGHAARAVNIPLDDLTANLERLEKQEPIYVICETGNRSRKAADLLRGAGFKQVINVAGGTSAWKAAGLPMDSKPPHGVQSPN